MSSIFVLSMVTKRGDEFVGVFSTREKAVLYRNAVIKTVKNPFMIREYEVDSLSAEQETLPPST